MTHDRARAFEALFGARMPLPEQNESPRSGQGLPDPAILFARPKDPPEPSPAPAQLPSGSDGPEPSAPATAIGLLFTTVRPANTEPGSGGAAAAAGESYEVGYKKPPKDRRFKKGQSGNKAGRPKRPKGVSEALESVLSTVVGVRENGKRKRMTRLEAMLLTAVTRVMASPDLKGFSSLMSALKTAGMFDAKSASQGPTGVLVVPSKSGSIEEWIQEHGLAARTNGPPPEAYLPDPRPK